MKIWTYSDQVPIIERTKEMGRFHVGSRRCGSMRTRWCKQLGEVRPGGGGGDDGELAATRATHGHENPRGVAEIANGDIGKGDELGEAGWYVDEAHEAVERDGIKEIGGVVSPS